MNEKSSLNGLLQRLSRALTRIPGATSLYVFGSITSDTYDALSDLDLMLFTTDLESALATRYTVIAEVHPIQLEWPMQHTAQRWAAALVLDGVGPFQKVDLGFADASLESAWRAEQPARLLWSRAPGEQTDIEPQPLRTAPFSPQPGTVEHFVVDHLLGATRYVKARARGQELTAWRFATALAQATLTLRYATTFNTWPVGPKLTTQQYLDLDRALPPPTRQRSIALLHASDSVERDARVHQLALELLDHLDDQSRSSLAILYRIVDAIATELAQIALR